MEEQLQMDRSEVPQSQRESSTMSLADKLKAHYKTGPKKPRKLTNPLTPECINKFAVPIYLFTVFSSVKIGILDVMPLIYASNDNIVILHQCFVVLIFTEMMLNWFGIRYVDSSYSRYQKLYGKPTPLAAKGNILTSPQANTQTESSKKIPLMQLATPQKPDGTREEIDCNSNSQSDLEPGSIIRGGNSSLNVEADLANSEMLQREAQMNGIADLINVSETREMVQPVLQTSQTFLFSSSESIPFSAPMPTVVTNGKTVTQTFPYWSWIPCYNCNSARPPRCHHCPLCQICILKRDHHCYFAGNCVGYRNHRFFCVFLIWAWLGCVYATLHGFPYIYFYLWPDMSYFDVIAPFAILRFLFGYVSFQAALSVTTLTLLLYFDSLTMTFIYTNTRLVLWGLTSFEKAFLKKSLEIKDTRNTSQKIHAVFGKYWILGFLFPTFFFTEPDEDPVYWQDIKVYKH